jgi:hypothetical protein
MNRDQTLDDLLDAYVTESGKPNHETLNLWSKRYPHYARELATFTADWSMMTWLPAAGGELADEAALVQRGMQTVQQLLDERLPAASSIATLVGEGQARGLAVGDLAAKAGLSIPLVLKLDRRLIRFATIPAQLVDDLARAVGRDVAAVATYLQGGPQLARGASYHARQTPAISEPESFSDAVQGDLTLTAEQRQRLLALPSPDAENR